MTRLSTLPAVLLVAALVAGACGGGANQSARATTASPSATTRPPATAPSALAPTPTAVDPSPTAADPTPTAAASSTGAPRPTANATPAATNAPSTASSPQPTPAAASPAPTVAAVSRGTWTKLRPADGPGPREDHTWTVDEAGARAYVFGGRAGATLHGDLWSYDLATDSWVDLTVPGGPDARFGHEAAWLPGRGLVIFAGQAGPRFFNDLWLYDAAAATWSRLPSSGAEPVARYGSCAAIGPDGRLWISHGFTEDGARFADTRAYDFASGTWTDETPAGDRPVERCLHGCWFDEAGDLVLYAGQTTGVTALGDLWRLGSAGTDGAAWRRIEGDLPAARNLYAHATSGSARIVFGGRGNDGYWADVWAIDPASIGELPRALEVSGDAPPARSGAELVADPARGRVLLFGGRHEGGTFADVWQLVLE